MDALWTGIANGFAARAKEAIAAAGLRLLRPADCAAESGRPAVLKGLVSAGDLALLIGAPGCGKSTLAPALGYAVAQGRPFLGSRTRAGAVLYVAAEDAVGMRGRVAALRQRHGDAPGFAMIDGVTSLAAGAQADALVELIRTERPALVILDTLAAAFPGLRENEAADMASVVALARRITSCCGPIDAPAVLLLHHVPRDAATPRGHGVLEGAADVIMLLSRRAKGDVTVQIAKNRAGPTAGARRGFRIETETVGIDEDGDAITAPVAVETEATEPAADQSVVIADLRRQGLSVRAIAEKTGVPKSSVSRTLANAA